tara:strand:+ start:233 stop:451 length:219 start_codon:yes stop_codon:yes gene_type:complete
MKWFVNQIKRIGTFLNPLEICGICLGGTSTSPQVTNLSDLKVTELKAMAKEQGLTGYTGLRKAELVKILSQN